MKRRTRWMIAAAIGVAAGAGVGGGVAMAGGGESETPITGAALTSATQAALAYTHGGTVTGTEAGDEESAYEVEVTLADGKVVDVQLNDAFAVVSSKADVEDGK